MKGTLRPSGPKMAASQNFSEINHSDQRSCTCLKSSSAVMAIAQICKPSPSQEIFESWVLILEQEMCKLQRFKMCVRFQSSISLHEKKEEIATLRYCTVAVADYWQNGLVWAFSAAFAYQANEQLWFDLHWPSSHAVYNCKTVMVSLIIFSAMGKMEGTWKACSWKWHEMTLHISYWCLL